MYHIKDGRIPSDTRMREVLDSINSEEIRKPFKKIFSLIQRSGTLKKYKFRCGKLKDYYLMPIDETGLFHSKKCGFDYCCKKYEDKPNEANYHNLMGGCIVHPDQKAVIPQQFPTDIRQWIQTVIKLVFKNKNKQHQTPCCAK